MHEFSCAFALAVIGCGANPPSPGVAPPPVASAVAPALEVPKATSVRLPDGASPLRYELSLRVNPTQATFAGSARIRVRVDRKLERLVLHGRAMEIRRASIDGSLAGVGHRFAFGGKEDPEELVLTPSAPLLPGEHQIELDYEAPFDGRLRGLYKVEQNGKAWAFTQLEAIDARRMFPCFDEPRYKTPFTLRVETPPGMIAVSNTPIAEKTETGPATLWDFKPTQPIPSYLVALAVGELDITDGPERPVPIRVVTVPGKGPLGANALRAASSYTDVLSAYFDRAYPYEKLDVAALPDFGPGAMENPGFITFREDILLMDPARAPVKARRRMEIVMAHELAHQWFGNLVTMDFWDDLWLNEGFATWMAAKAVDAATPEVRAVSDLLRGKLNVMNSDALASARPVRVPIETSDAIFESGGWTAYVKGQSLLTMLEAHVGEIVFRDAIRAYLEAHAFGTVTSEDFVRAVSAGSGKDLTPIARSFLDQPGVPVVSARLDCAPGTTTLHLEQAPLRALPEAPPGETKLWSIPLCVKVDGAPQPVCMRLDSAATEVQLPRCPRWVFPNHAAKGYFRSRLPPEALHALSKVSRTALTEAERATLIADSWALVQAGSMTPSDALDVIANLDVSREPSRLVVEQVIDVLTAVQTMLIDDRSAPRFRAFVSRLLSPILNRLGDGIRPREAEEDRLFRLSVMAALFDLADDRRVALAAERRVAAYLEDPRSVDPDLIALSLRISARVRGVATPAALRARLPNADPSERLALILALGSSGEPDVLRGMLADIVQGKLRAGDVRYLQGAASRRPDSRAVFSDWAVQHLDELRIRGGAEMIAGLVGWTCEPERRDRMKDFYHERLARLEGTRRPFEEGLRASELCIALRSRYARPAGRWFEKP